MERVTPPFVALCFPALFLVLGVQVPFRGGSGLAPGPTQKKADLQPLHYDLTLLTYVESISPKFKGVVHIKILCVEPTNMIVLNQKYLAIKTKRVRVWELIEEEEERVLIVQDHGHSFDNNFDRYIILLKETLKKDSTYKLTIDFSKHSDFRSSAYIDVPYRDKELHPDINHIVFTRMNKIEARTVFPNFDNLDKKATLTIRIGHDSTAKAISNSKLVSKKPMYYPSGWVMDEFAEIKNRLSTFSIALAVADFESDTKKVSALGPNRVRSVITIQVSAEKGVLKIIKNETFRVVTEAFEHFSSFLNVPYELEKLDIVVMPDSKFDVLGYYGLIFLGEEAIREAYEQPSKKFSAIIHSMASKVCHAISAQWIGHSVTMATWNDSWLHVGLNKFLEKDCVDVLFPDWRLSTERNIINSFLDLLRTEERGEFNPIIAVGSFFTFSEDSVNDETISKVHFTIRMLSFILNAGKEKDKFEKSLMTYLEKFKSDNSEIRKVWEIFTTIANEYELIIPDDITVEQIMDSWLAKKGHPIINVTRKTESNKIIITQEPFDSFNNGKVENDQQICWIIPIRYRIKNDSDEFQKRRIREWLKSDCTPLEIDVQDGEWILFNLNLHARVFYDEENWKLIHDLLKNVEEYKTVELFSRMHLISDMFAFAEAEKISYELVFNVMKYLTHENSHQCWQLAYQEIMRIRSRWLGTNLFEPFRKYILSIVRPIFNEIETNKTMEKFVRSNKRFNLFENIIVKLMCTFEDDECQKFGEKVLGTLLTNTKDPVRDLIPEGLVESIYCLGVKNIDEKNWEYLYKKFALKNDSILHALGCSSSTTILRKFLVYGHLVIQGNIRPEFCSKVFNSLLSNKLGYEVIENFLNSGMKNFSIHLLKQGTAITAEDMLAKVLEATKSTESLKRLFTAYTEIKTRVEDRAILLEESMFKATKNMAWIQKHETSLLTYFQKLQNNKSVAISKI